MLLFSSAIIENMYKVKDFLNNGELIVYMMVLPDFNILVVTVDPLGHVWSTVRDVNGITVVL